ncbi:DNA-binding transcriptional regulator, CsgD family [Microbulbifer donghaiensis]|uniref:DNA-binding transcriptional regulator, CsgD family n=1 Tax=Microbulbifer donghaiensis TaxID=494016 RepID=A0A1M5AUV9_9GAMM|nr:helix-turn-helix transcriptional regulator [Microbulbifer donghaiensis]SHF34051.1 DNA-binding transcriptional regulator, CsgD family [Microbulbifer donghaiensis]
MSVELARFEAWNRKAAELLVHSGCVTFYEELVAAIRTLAAVDHPQVWLYCRNQPPRILFYDIDAQEQEVQIDFYRDGSYLLDPFYMAISNNSNASGVYRLTEIGPSEFKQSDYFHSYYAQLDTRDEIVFMMEVDADTSLHLCLMRSHNSDEFSCAELDLLRAAEPMVRNLVVHHMNQLDSASREKPAEWLAVTRTNPGIGNSINQAFNMFGRSILSGRERDVLGLMLRGNSTRYAAEKLGIAVDTLRKHRKHIYEKLDVSSQSELFSLFLNAISSVDSAANEDPLSIYLGSTESRP